MAVFIRRVAYVDVNGRVRTGQTVGNASMVAVEAAILLMSNADEATESEAQVFINAAPAPVNATYLSVEDVADIWYSTAGGEIISISIFAPRSTIFLADQETVDPASVAGLSATVIGVITTLGGAAAAAFVGGRRRPRS